jgi:beta-alanine--pyruvate transaminase
VFADAMMSLKGLPHVVDIRTIGLLAAIDLDPIPGKVGLRGYSAIERMYANHDLYCRVTADTIVPSPPLIVTESQIGEITDKLKTVIKAVA